MILLRRLRRDMYMSLSDFVEATGYKADYIIAIEAGEVRPPDPVLEQFAAVLNWKGEPFALLGEVGEK